MSSTSSETNNQSSITTDQQSQLVKPDVSRRTFFRNPLNLAKQQIDKVTEPMADGDFFKPTDDDGSQVSRRNLLDTARDKTKGIIGNVVGEGLDLMGVIVNAVGDKVLPRKRFIIGSFAVLTIGMAIEQVLRDNNVSPADLKLRAELSDVWDEVEELRNPPTHEELLSKVYNSYKPIELTGEELDNAAIVTIEDSEGVVDGNRKNSLGPDQPGSWPILAAQKLTDGLRLLGRLGKVVAYNFAQPGTSILGTLEYENPQGNVQLGAKTSEDMAMDHPGEPIPTEFMKAHKGFLIADYGIHGDDMRDTAEALLKYVDPDSPKYSAKFVDFLQHPTKEKIENDDEILAMTKEVLTSYKGDKTRIQTKFGAVLDHYEDIFKTRTDNDMGRGVLVVSQPDAMDKYPTIPYVKPGSPRGTKGALDVAKYGEVARLAALWTMAPFYYIEGPMLKEWEARTGIPVSCTPIMALKIPLSHLSKYDSHLGLLGHEDRANGFVEIVKVKDGNNNLVFEKDGTSHLAA